MLRNLFTQLADWPDLSHLKEPERRRTALASSKALKAEIKAYPDPWWYLEATGRERHREREAEGRPRPSDHARLQRFQERFDNAIAGDPQARGNVLRVECRRHITKVLPGPFAALTPPTWPRPLLVRMLGAVNLASLMFASEQCGGGHVGNTRMLYDICL